MQKLMAIFWMMVLFLLFMAILGGASLALASLLGKVTTVDLGAALLPAAIISVGAALLTGQLIRMLMFAGPFLAGGADYEEEDDEDEEDEDEEDGDGKGSVVFFTEMDDMADAHEPPRRERRVRRRR